MILLNPGVILVAGRARRPQASEDRWTVGPLPVPNAAGVGGWTHFNAPYAEKKITIDC